MLRGLAGDDVLRGGAGADRLIGGAGIDTVSYTDSAAAVTVSLTSRAGSGGDAQGDIIEAENANGSHFNDAIYGDAGANVLNGWAGRDILEGRGGADRFVLSDASHSNAGANADKITDFSHAQGDRIDLSAIDANTTVTGDQAFLSIGSAAYSRAAGELHYAVSGSNTIIGGDINGDGISDFNIVLTGRIALVDGDFVL